MKSFEHGYLVEQPISQRLLMAVRTIGEFRGRQILYERQSPEVLETLRRAAMIQSVESSNRIEGVTIPGERLRPVMRFPHYAAAFHVIETTDFALIVPLSLARLHNVEIQQLPLDGLKLTLHLYWRRDTDRDPACVWAREQLASAVRESTRDGSIGN